MNRNSAIPAQPGILRSRHRTKIPACARMIRSAVMPMFRIAAQAGILQRRQGFKFPGFMTTTLLVVSLGINNALALDLGGHTKLQATTADLPDDSLLQDFGDDPQRDSNLDLRLKLATRIDAWSWHVDYQLQARQGDRLALQQRYPELDFGAGLLPDDEQRVFDLSHRISDEENQLVVHRLDRLYLSHTSKKTVFNIGRQTLSWGNGLIYNPVDFFNPFDPAAIDTEYKTGDDMLYAQYLLDSGDDLQAVWVGRRDEDDHVSQDVSSFAFKYHRFADASEFDLLAAEHYETQSVALGGSIDFADAIWRGDIMLTDTASEQFTSAVLNWSYSWISWGKNISAALEYFHNGFGIDDGDYSPLALAANPELLARIQRGELFTLGENYLATTVTIELTPLWLLTSSLFYNLDDNSALLQLFSQHDLQQDLQLLLALNLPDGSEGSEFGGIDSGIADQPLAVGTSLFAQLAWYF